jgi:sugar phosphate isomerase/epimerase
MRKLNYLEISLSGFNTHVKMTFDLGHLLADRKEKILTNLDSHINITKLHHFHKEENLQS